MRPPISRRREGAWVLLLSALLISVPALIEAGELRIRYAILVASGVLAAEVLVSLRAPSSSSRWRLGGYVGGSLVLVAWLSLIVDTGPFDVAKRLVPLMLVWSCLLAITRWLEAGPPGREIDEVSSRGWLAAIVLLGLAAWLPEMAFGRRYPTIIDEVLYLLQAQHVVAYPFGRALPSDLSEHFVLRQSYVANGYMYGQYPPGWPLALFPFDALGLRWLAPLTAYVGAVLGTFALAEAMGSRTIALIAAALVALNASFLSVSATYFPHAFTALLMVWAGALMLRGLRTGRTAGFVGAWGLAGLLLGWAVATRPVTGATLTVSLWVWLILFERPVTPVLVRAAAIMLIAGAVPVGWMLYYNAIATGHPLQFGYQVANHGLQGLGLGARGFVVYTSQGLPREVVNMFGPREVVRDLLANLLLVPANFWAGYAIVPLLYVSTRFAIRVRWRLVAPFLALPAGYAFWFYRSERFYVELIPFAAVATGVLIRELMRRSRALGVGVLLVLVTSSLPAWTSDVRVRDDGATAFQRELASLETLRQQDGPLLLLVRESGQGREPLLEALYWLNLGAFPGDVIVARDLETGFRELARRFPDHHPVRVTWGGCEEGQRRWCMTFAPLGPPDER